MSTSDATTSPESEHGEAFEAALQSDGQGNVAVTVTRGNIRGDLAFTDATEIDDQDLEEFFRLLPAVVDRAFDAFLAQTTSPEEGQPS